MPASNGFYSWFPSEASFLQGRRAAVRIRAGTPFPPAPSTNSEDMNLNRVLSNSCWFLS